MKKHISKPLIPLSILPLLLFSQCSWFEQNLDGSLSTFISVYESSSNSNIPYNTFEYIDASSDEDISKNLDKIKDWTVKEVSYKIWGFYGDPNTSISGELGFSRESENSPSIKATFTNIMPANITDNDVSYKVNLSESDLNKIADYLDKDQFLKIYLNGVLSQGPTSFQLEVIAKVKVKTKLL